MFIMSETLHLIHLFIIYITNPDILKKFLTGMKSQNSIPLFSFVVVPPYSAEAVSNGTLSYLIGGIIAMLILGYLIYTLLHPDKF